MIKFKIKKLNNQGSTFVLSLLVITLLTTLALALANASIGNMMMKSVDRGAKKNFYTAESLLDEVRAGVGRDSLDKLAGAYEKVLTNLVKFQTSDKMSVKDNASANAELKEVFIDNVISAITQDSLLSSPFGSEQECVINDDETKTKVIAYLKEHIKGNQYVSDMGKVTSVGDIRAYKDSDQGYKWIVIIEDVAFTYKEKKSGEIQFSNITADIEIEYPNMTVDFTATNRITDFVNYALIADGSIQIAGQTVEVNASAYAGHLIDIAPLNNNSAYVTFKSDAASKNIDVVCGGDNIDNGSVVSGTIRIAGSENAKSTAHFMGANIWCSNLTTISTTANEVPIGVDVVIDDRCNSYVKDDLSAEAQNSNIKVDGEYYGYMYDGTDAGHAASSAIIVNGKNTKLSIGARKLMIGGHAYIDIGKNGASIIQYMTGETLSLKGNQDVYLVPPRFIGVNYSNKLSNPMSETAWNMLIGSAASDSNIKICEVDSSYFVKQKDYVYETPYVAKTINGMVYVYWNFKNKDSARKYIADVVSGVEPELRDKLKSHNMGLLESGSVSVSTNSANIDASGIFMEYEDGVPSYINPGNTMPNIFRLTSGDLAERYKIMTHLLTNVPWDSGNARYYVTDAVVALEQLKGINVENNELIQSSIIYNIVNMENLTGDSINEYNRETHPIKYGDGSKLYTKVAVSGNYTVPDGSVPGVPKIDGGIIVATGSVTLNHDFDGLIIAGGNINLVGNAKLTTNATLIEEFITGKEDFMDERIEHEDLEFKYYFLAYKGGAVEDDNREAVKIENIDYKDLVQFNNWRKYED